MGPPASVRRAFLSGPHQRTVATRRFAASERSCLTCRRSRGRGGIRQPVHRVCPATMRRRLLPVSARMRLTLLVAVIATLGCSRNRMSAHQVELNDVAARYAAAWSSRNPESVAAFYSDRGSLTVNDGMPAVGRPAIAATARRFMTAFPDMVVRVERVEDEN